MPNAQGRVSLIGALAEHWSAGENDVVDNIKSYIGRGVYCGFLHVVWSGRGVSAGL